MNKHVIVISEDALVYEDTETLRKLPVFGSVWEQTARIDRIRSIYPTVTYPCHTTMMTGCYPDKHGITNNELYHLFEKSSDWNWYYDRVKVPSIFDEAKKHGLSTADVYWPVTGNCPSIDYLVAECWPHRFAGETDLECYREVGTSEDVIQKAVVNNLWLQKNRIHPNCEEFIHACACAMIREYKPNLLMIHPANVDGYRHQTGVFSEKVTHGLHEIDNWLGWIIKATREAGIHDTTDFFIVSDHGQINITRIICPNVELARRGLIKTDAEGKITDYTAISRSTGASAHVFLLDPQDHEAYERTYRELIDMRDAGIYGISEVFTAQEIEEKEHLSGPFSFVLETDGYTSFANDWNGKLIRAFDPGDYKFGRATHGHLPDKGPQPTFLAFGPSIKPGVRIPHARLIDLAPTIAWDLNLTLDQADGHAVKEIYR